MEIPTILYPPLKLTASSNNRKRKVVFLLSTIVLLSVRNLPSPLIPSPLSNTLIPRSDIIILYPINLLFSSYDTFINNRFTTCPWAVFICTHFTFKFLVRIRASQLFLPICVKWQYYLHWQRRTKLVLFWGCIVCRREGLSVHIVAFFLLFLYLWFFLVFFIFSLIGIFLQSEFCEFLYKNIIWLKSSHCKSLFQDGCISNNSIVKSLSTSNWNYQLNLRLFIYTLSKMLYVIIWYIGYSLINTFGWRIYIYDL